MSKQNEMSLIPFFNISDDVHHYTGIPFLLLKDNHVTSYLKYAWNKTLYESLRLFSVWQLDLVS